MVDMNEKWPETFYEALSSPNFLKHSYHVRKLDQLRHAARRTHTRTPAVRAIIITLGPQSTVFHLKKELLLARKSAVQYMRDMRETASGLVSTRTDGFVSLDPVRSVPGDLGTPGFLDWYEDFETGDDHLASMAFWTTKEAGVTVPTHMGENDKETLGPPTSNDSVDRE
jgi:hypothetical protein